MTASRRGFVVGGGQIGIGDEGGDGGPIVEDLAGECPNLLGIIVAVKLAGPLQPGKHRIEDARAGALGDLVDQAAYLAQQPRPAPCGLRPPARATPLRIRWAKHLCRFLNDRYAA